jgi:hypothetical protein
VDPGALWWFVGDSQTDGRDTGVTKSHAEPFCEIWQRTAALDSVGPAAPYTGLGSLSSSSPLKNGESGRTLSQSRAYYDAKTTGNVHKTNVTFLWIQESGNQAGDGGSQDTPAKYKALIKAWAIAAKANSASVVIIIETSFSFGREGEAGRNWNAYNDAFWEAVAELESEEEITVYVVDTDSIIKRLQTAIGASAVWFQSNESNAYHYKGPGNLAIALGGFHALGYDIEALDLSGITTVSTENKAECIAAVLG